MRTTHYEFVLPHLSRIHDPLPFMAVPLIFLYVRTLTARTPSSPRREFLHFIPFVLSQIINERLKQNFVDFINTYRVEEAKRKLLAPHKSHYSVLAIAEEAGFNSKSSFNSVFKKHARMTPSEFRKAFGGDGR